MELDLTNLADQTAARKIAAVRDHLTDAEKRTLSRELATKNPNIRTIEKIVNSK